MFTEDDRYYAVEASGTQDAIPEPQTPATDDYVFTVKSKDAGRVVLPIEGQTVTMMVDTGANCNIINHDVWTKVNNGNNGRLQLTRCNRNLFPYGTNTPMKILGMFKGQVKVTKESSMSQELEFVVVPGNDTPLLGKDSSVKLGLLSFSPHVYEVKSEVDTEYLVNVKYAECFKGLGKLKHFQLKIHIDPEVQPVAQAVKRVPFSMRQRLDKKLDQLEKLDVIEKLNGPTPWTSPLVVIFKTNDDVRVCVDMRRPNEAVLRERHPIPTLHEILGEMSEATLFSKLDLTMGYHQIELEPESRGITTFTTHKGLYRYKRLVFGLSSASEIYQHLIQQTLQ